MSIWTHVNASIRVDALRLEGVPKIEFEKLLVVSTYDAPNPCCNMPCGSEGSLHWSLWENPSESSLAAYTVSIFGDLRDYGKEDLKEIEKWWKSLNKKLFVRQAILQVTFEDDDYCYVYDEKKRIAKYRIYGEPKKKKRNKKSS